MIREFIDRIAARRERNGDVEDVADMAAGTIAGTGTA